MRLKQERMAKMMGVTVQTLITWSKERGMPVIKVQGVRPEYDTEECYKWKYGPAWEKFHDEDTKNLKEDINNG